MKKHNYLFLLVFLLVSTLANSQEAKTDVTEKKGSQAVMLFRYYYYPNLQIYYDTLDDVYLCKDKDNQWVKKNQLPGNTRGYSMSNNIYVLIKEYVGDTPYEFIEQHKKDFPANYKSKKSTKVIVREK